MAEYMGPAYEVALRPRSVDDGSCMVLNRVDGWFRSFAHPPCEGAY